MRRSLTAIAVLASSAAALASLPAGVAHAGHVVPGVMGGGAMLVGDHNGSGNLLIALRATPDDRVRISANLQVSCPGAGETYVDVSLSPTAVVAPDGTFRATGTRVERLGPTAVTTAYDIAGSFTASGASGTATVSLEDDDPILPTCGSRSSSTGQVAWQARRPTAAGARGPVAVGLLYGTTSQRIGGARGAIVLRVSPDGRAVDRVVHFTRLRCTRRAVTPSLTLDNDPWFSRNRMRIDSKGAFGERYDLSASIGPVVSHAAARFAGTLGVLGASGVFRQDARFVSRRTGRVRERCTTGGVIRWSAAR